MRARVSAAVLSVLFLAGCAATSDATSTPPTTDPDTTAATPAGQASADAPATFVMPDVTGMVLQDAQDVLQAAGSFLMDQTDASGQGRMQVDDSNWQVCGQAPDAGNEVPTTVMVQLSAVKLDETCP